MPCTQFYFELAMWLSAKRSGLKSGWLIEAGIFPNKLCVMFNSVCQLD